LKIKKTYLPLFLVQIFLLFVGARLLNLSKYGLWLDEVFSVETAKLDWMSLFDKVIYDVVHPPLFYALLKIWIIIGGDSLIWVKTLPVLFALFALIPLYFLCRELKIDSTEFCLALTFISLNSYQIFFAQELRMYSLLAFVSLWSMWLFIRFLREDSRSLKLEAILLFVNLLLVYTHYFGWFTILAEVVFVFFREKTKFKRFFIQTFFVGACFLPWSYLVFSAALKKGGLGENLSWLEKPGFSGIFLFFAEIQGTMPIPKATTAGFLLFLPPVLLWVRQIVRQRNSEDLSIFTFLGLVSALPVTVAFLLGQILKTPVWSERYFIASAVPYTLLLAISISRIKDARLKKVFLTLTILWTLGAGAWNIFYYRKRIDWAHISNRIVQTDAAPNSPIKIFVSEEWLRMPLQNSLDEIQSGRLNVEKVNTIDDVNEKEFWFGYRQTMWNEQESPPQKIEKKNCTVKSEAKDEIFDEKVNVLFVKCNE